MGSEKQRTLFRQESLERLSSPERLDQLMQVIGPKDWLPLASLSCLLIVALIWSIFGRIPITVAGNGVLIRPRKLVVFQSTGTGQLREIKVKVGTRVKKGQVLALMDQPETTKQLEQQKNKLKELEGQALSATSLQSQRTALEIQSLQQQRQSLLQRIRETESFNPILKDKGIIAIQRERESLEERIQETQSLNPVLRDKGIIAIQRERQSLQERIDNEQATAPLLVNQDKATIEKDRENLIKRLQETQELTPAVKRRWEKFKELLERKVITEDIVLQAQQEYLSSIARRADLESQLKQLDLKQSQSQKSYRDTLNNISNLKAQLRGLEVREVEAQKSYRENLTSISNIRAQLRGLDVREVEALKAYRENLNNIANLQSQLKELDTREKSLAQQNLESTVNRENQIRDLKRSIATLELQLQNNTELRSEHEGNMIEITATEGQVVNSGQRLGLINAEDTKSDLVAITYFPIQDGKKIKPGMPIQITPTTVKRERFGGILGKVSEVSSFPITKEGAASVVGIPELAESLGAQGLQIEVQSLMQKDSYEKNISGYKWSSSKEGPNLKVTSGTTTTVRVTVEEQPPITFVLPFLKSLFGVD